MRQFAWSQHRKLNRKPVKTLLFNVDVKKEGLSSQKLSNKLPVVKWTGSGGSTCRPVKGDIWGLSDVSNVLMPISSETVLGWRLAGSGADRRLANWRLAYTRAELHGYHWNCNLSNKSFQAEPLRI